MNLGSISTLNGVGLPSVGHAIRENQCVLPIQEVMQLAFYSLLKELRLRDLRAENLNVKEQIVTWRKNSDVSELCHWLETLADLGEGEFV